MLALLRPPLPLAWEEPFDSRCYETEAPAVGATTGPVRRTRGTGPPRHHDSSIRLHPLAEYWEFLSACSEHAWEGKDSVNLLSSQAATLSRTVPMRTHMVAKGHT